MRNKNDNSSERHCVVCNNILVGYQKKYCSKECEIKDRKGKKVGPYNRDRVDAMAEGKWRAYEERYINPYKDLIDEYLSYNYINNIPQLINHIGIPLVNANAFFRHYSEKKKQLYSAPRLPRAIQDFNPDKFLQFKNKILNSEISTLVIKNIALEYNLSGEEVHKCFIELRPNDYDIILNTKIPIFNKDGNIIKSHQKGTKYVSEDEKINKSKSNIYKYYQIKKKFEEDHIENIFKETLYFTCRDDYEKFLKNLSSKYNCMYQMVLRYLDEKNIKPVIDYKRLIPIRNFSEMLGITMQDLENIINDLLKIQDYVALKSEYIKLADKFEDKIRKAIPSSEGSRVFEYIKEKLEHCDYTNGLKRVRKSYFPVSNGTEKYLLDRYGKEFLIELKGDIRGIKNSDDFFIFRKKYKDSIRFQGTNSNFYNYANTLNPDFILIKDKSVNNSISKYGGSSIEEKIIEFLKLKNANFETQVKLKSDKMYGVFKIDVVLNNKICIEIQGDYWHGNPLLFKATNEQIKMLENSVFPGFIYNNIKLPERKDLNEFQINNFDKDYRKKLKMAEYYGYNNIYYIWEYDIEHHWEEVKLFLEKLIDE